MTTDSIPLEQWESPTPYVTAQMIPNFVGVRVRIIGIISQIANRGPSSAALDIGDGEVQIELVSNTRLEIGCPLILTGMVQPDNSIREICSESIANSKPLTKKGKRSVNRGNAGQAEISSGIAGKAAISSQIVGGSIEGNALKQAEASTIENSGVSVEAITADLEKSSISEKAFTYKYFKKPISKKEVVQVLIALNEPTSVALYDYYDESANDCRNDLSKDILPISFPESALKKLWTRLNAFFGLNLPNDLLENPGPFTVEVKKWLERENPEFVKQSDLFHLIECVPKAGVTEVSSGDVKSLVECFYLEFEGRDKIVTPFVNAVRQLYKAWATEKEVNGSKPFAPYTCVIGPSMCGKSRTVYEASKSFYSFYICIRKEESTGYPSRTAAAASYLLEFNMTNVMSAKMVEKRYRCFILAMFKLWDGRKSREDWINFQLQEISSESSESPKEYWRNVVGLAEDLLKQESIDSDVNEMKKIMAKYIDELQYLIVLDEARVLTQLATTEGINYFRRFRRAMRSLNLGGTFYVLLDTTSKISNFNPSYMEDPSLRLNPKMYYLLPPWYQIASNSVFALKSPPKNLDELQYIDRLMRYGLPHFYRFFSVSKEDNKVKATIEIAQSKLLGTPVFGFQEDTMLTENRVLAILGPLVCPTVSVTSSSCSELVSSHCAHCVAVSSDLNSMYTSYGSSFIFPEAALQILCRLQRPEKIFSKLQTIMARGNISRGDSGELITKILLILALKQHLSVKIPVEYPLSGKVIKLKDFLSTLVGSENMEIVRQSIQKHPKLHLLLESFIFFNHFCQVNYWIKDADLLRLLCAGAFAQARECEQDFDFYAPILFPSQPSVCEDLEDRIKKIGKSSDFNGDMSVCTQPLLIFKQTDGPVTRSQTKKMTEQLNSSLMDSQNVPIDHQVLGSFGVQSKNVTAGVSLDSLFESLGRGHSRFLSNPDLPSLSIIFSLKEDDGPFEFQHDESHLALKISGIQPYAPYLNEGLAKELRKLRDCRLDCLNLSAEDDNIFKLAVLSKMSLSYTQEDVAGVADDFISFY